MASGSLVAIVGPSGAGKDTLIAHARVALSGDPRFYFVRRMVTRPANAFEDHDTLAASAFDAGHATGGFALSWRAHGLGYALPIDIVAKIETGAVAVSNLSRGAVPAARERFGDVRVVSITAPLDVLAGRLAGRGRESLEAIRERLRREALRERELAADLVIANDGPVEAAGAALIDYLVRLPADATV